MRQDVWQGRYQLFLYRGVTTVAAWLLSAHGPRLGFLAPRVTWVGSSLIAVYGMIAFALVMARYVVGGEAQFGKMISAPQWEPPLGSLSLIAGYAIASIALVVLVGLAATRIARREAIVDVPTLTELAGSASPHG